MHTKPIIAVLGDYERCLQDYADWSPIQAHSKLRFFHEPLSGESLYEAVHDADAIALVRDRSPFDASLIKRLPKLKLFVFTGTRNALLDHTALLHQGVTVACTRGGPSKETTAELTWALILAASKQVVDQSQMMSDGQWRNAHSVLPMLHGQRLGIIGLGGIGSLVAKVGAAFGMELVCWSPNMTHERANAAGCEFLPLETLLQTSKIVSLHLVASERTKGLIHRDRLAMMRTDSILVNTARSSLIVTNDLIAALKSGRPGQAALDVFDQEPLPKESELHRIPNLLMTPHLGFVAEPIFQGFAQGLVDTLDAWLNGKPVPMPYPANS
ncbi:MULTISPECIES: D-2-hydroxyacid dehydrogenase family protein [unclassified Polynucleobacter]|uniref:D-2-hydroxyacid dehydrogenase family protein n=1 Tax=unclassified Polynucleobacter TaxID=2640945 RepID=UPI0025748235|nr:MULTISPECIES: D-2-hydroxyacid dehydrogenase family protein [unclassified Polynucleobacter]BEI42259.1 D-2-hydroxyacid dehydrogenase family protein [Polynucleobacter sp. HIN10]BEI44012.1 D-2-hydroxyacid dehydrogenase family protein [Polynucleobacter sp. HIN11]